jgi:Arc/MetJ-type ribon-helix-helix transcriptional regulator
MNKAKIAITLDQETVKQLDRLIQNQTFRNRSHAIQQAVAEKLERLDRGRLARECAKLDPGSEQDLAEEGFTEDIKQWPEY